MNQQNKLNLKKLALKALALSVVLIAVLPAIALADGPGFGGGVNDGGGGCSVPLDGGLSYLAAAGIGYGVKMFVSSRKNASKA
jgi:hypothetical protein